MNRLQKKCLIATIGFHLSLLLILIFGSAFFNPSPQPDNTQVLDMIPANVIDAAFNHGVKNARPPAPTPVVHPPTPVTPPPPAPQPVTPTPTPPPTLVEKVERIFKPTPPQLPPDDTKPAEDVPRPKPHQIKVNLNQITRNTRKNSEPKKTTVVSHEHQFHESTLNNVLNNLKANLTSATEVDLPGESSAAYANYGSAVVSAYHQAWLPPDNMAEATAVVRFTVTIARDGRVISARIVTASGDASVNRAVQRMLDRVSFIQKFPADTKDTQRTYNIDFNATRTN